LHETSLACFFDVVLYADARVMLQCALLTQQTWSLFGRSSFSVLSLVVSIGVWASDALFQLLEKGHVQKWLD
jgi:hypothetical protein